MKTIIALILSLGIAIGGDAAAMQGPAEPHDKPRYERVISLDICADQYVLKLLDHGQILALSPDATAPFSYMREEARGIKTLAAKPEDILALRPDLVVRSYGGGHGIEQLLGRAGIDMVQVGYASSLTDLGGLVQQVADGLGEPERGHQLVQQMTDRLAAIRAYGEGRTALYMTATGVTTGPGTLIHDMMNKAGLQNFHKRAGWHDLPLERLVLESPDFLIASFFGSGNVQNDRWSATRHPVAQRRLSDIPQLRLSGAITACGAWYLIDAIEAMAHQVEPETAR